MNIFQQFPGGFKNESFFKPRNVFATNVQTKKPIPLVQTGGMMESYGVSKPSYPGEKHVYMKVPGGIVKANFAGPGTNLKERLARGDQPVNYVDKVAMAHDLRYGQAKDYSAVRRADEIMINALDNAPPGADSQFNVNVARGVMKSKLALEDMGAVKPGFFATHGKDHSPETQALYAQQLVPLEQQGLGVLGGKVKKGSVEAKERMAALRAIRSSRKKGGRYGKGLRLAGDGLRLAGDGITLAGNGKMAKKMLIRNKRSFQLKQRQAGGLGFLALAIPTLLGLVLKGGVSYGISKASDAAIKKIIGKGQKGGMNIPNIRELLRTNVSEPLKQEAVKILESVRDKPELVESAFKKLLPIITKMAQQAVNSQTGGMSEHEELTGSYSPGHETLEGPGVVQYIVDYVGQEIVNILKEIAAGGMKKIFGGKKGKGIITKAMNWTNKAVEDVTGAVSGVLSKLPAQESATIVSILSEIGQNPAILEDTSYLSGIAVRLSPMGVRALNGILRQKKIPVQISVNL